MPTYQVDGQPDDWDGPDFMKVGPAFARYLPGLVDQFKRELWRVPRVPCIIALDGTLVPSNIFEQLMRQGQHFNVCARMEKDPVGVSALVDSFYQRIGGKISPEHPGYLAQAKEAIAALVPQTKVALTIEQAAAAIGVPLEQLLGPLATSPQSQLPSRTA